MVSFFSSSLTTCSPQKAKIFAPIGLVVSHIKKATVKNIIKPIMNAQISGSFFFGFFRPEVPDDDRPEDDDRLPDIDMYLLKNIRESHSQIKQAYNPDQVYQKHRGKSEDDTVKFMTQRSGVSNYAGNQNSGSINSVTTVHDVYAEFGGGKRVVDHLGASTEDIHEDTGTMRHKRGEGNYNVFVNEIKLKRYNKKKDGGAERDIKSDE